VGHGKEVYEKMIDLIAKEMTRKRIEIPLLNRLKFDIETADVFERMKETPDPEVLEKLLADWRIRADYLATERRAFRAPARLLRKDGETAAEYLDRIYERSWKCRTM